MKVNRFLLPLILTLSGSTLELYSQEKQTDRDLQAALRAKAEQGDAECQFLLGVAFDEGHGVAEKDYNEALKWYRKAAEQNHAGAQWKLGVCYYFGQGVANNYNEAVKWLRKAAEQNDAKAQYDLGVCYERGEGVMKNELEAVTWYRKAAQQNLVSAEFHLGVCYQKGEGVPKNYVEGYKWYLLAAAQGDEVAKKLAKLMEDIMTPEQISEGQRLARDFTPRQEVRRDHSRPQFSGTGFFITEDGFLITNEHVAGSGAQVRLLTSTGIISAKVVKTDPANDLSLLKADGKFLALPIAESRSVQLGGAVATVGFPNIDLQGFAPKFARGEIASLSGPRDDARYFQISAPIQPGNSGGALVDQRGNVIGIVSAKLSAKLALSATGSLPENVNYAVKSTFLLGFLESMPDVVAKLTEPGMKEVKLEEEVERIKGASVLVLVY